MRVRGVVLAVLLFPLPLLGEDLPPPPDPPPPPPLAPAWTHDTSIATITRPAGGSVRHDARWAASPALRLGVFANWQVVSSEMGVSAGVVTDPAFLEAHVEGAAEPGFFVHAPPRRIGDGVDAETLETARTFGWRYVVRAQVNLNLRVSRLWIYSRTTAFGRWRDFVEDDTFRDIRVEDEYSIDQATAPIWRLSRSTSPAFWGYVEYTVGAVDGAGAIPHRVSTGVITEEWLAPRLSINLDVFWSFDVRGGRGPGAIVAVWKRW